MRLKRRHLLPVAALLGLASLAFVHLLAVPAFEDEGSQLRWIWRIIDAREWLAPLADGKPLEAWPMVPLVRIGMSPLVAMRALHVLAGMLGAVLTYALALQFGGRRSAFASGVLFALCPYVVYLQRFALSDEFLCTAGLWVLLCTLRFIDSPVRSRALALAAALVLAPVCKFPVGFFFLLSIPAALLLMPAAERAGWLRRPLQARLLALHVPVLLLLLAVAVTTTVRVRRGEWPGFGLHPLLGLAAGGFRDPAAAMGVARPGLVSEITTQLSWPAALIGLIGVVVAAQRPDWRWRWLIVMGVVPLLLIGVFAVFWYPRYLLFALPPLLVTAVLGWRDLPVRVPVLRRALRWGALAVCVVLMGRQSMLLILNPIAARWSPVDRFQYFEGWGSGYGYPEAARFVLTAGEAPSTIYSLDGHSAYQLRIYLPSSWASRVRPVFYGPDGAVLRDDNARLANLLRAPAWIVISKQLLGGYLASSFGPARGQFELREIAEFDKPGSRSQLALYAVLRR